MDLNVDDPRRVASVLRRAAEEYRRSAEELSVAWQDSRAGKEWIKISAILDRAADQAEKAAG